MRTCYWHPLGSLIGVWLGDSRVLVWALPAQPGPAWCSEAPGPLYWEMHGAFNSANGPVSGESLLLFGLRLEPTVRC